MDRLDGGVRFSGNYPAKARGGGNRSSSPDASRIAFTSERDGANRVWLMGADGTEQRWVTDLDSDYETAVAWLREADQLLVSIDSPGDGLRGWSLAGHSGELLGRVDALPAEICCGEGQVAYWQPLR